MVVWFVLEEDRVIPFQFSKDPRRGREMPHFESHWNMDYLGETKGRLEGPQELRRHRAETLPKKAGRNRHGDNYTRRAIEWT